MTRRDARAEILAVLADHQWHTANDVKAATGLSPSAIIYHLNDLARYPWGNPRLEKRTRCIGTIMYDRLATLLGPAVDLSSIAPGQTLHIPVAVEAEGVPHACVVKRVNRRSVTVEWSRRRRPGRTTPRWLHRIPVEVMIAVDAVVAHAAHLCIPVHGPETNPPGQTGLPDPGVIY